MVEEEVCKCPGANGYSLNRETGYWVHGDCGKPSRLVAVYECDLCHKEFVPKTAHEERVQLSFLGIACYDCDPH